jgi:hypothetical protein
MLTAAPFAREVSRFESCQLQLAVENSAAQAQRFDETGRTMTAQSRPRDAESHSGASLREKSLFCHLFVSFLVPSRI